MNEIVFGRNPVLEVLKSGRQVDKLFIAKGAEGSVKKIYAVAKDRGITVQSVERPALDRITGKANHQGTAAVVSSYKYCELEDVFGFAAERGEDPFLIVLDGVEDPHNLGAIMRTADAAGAHGIILPRRRSVSVTDAVEKSSAGAAEYVRAVRTSNIAQTIEQLKKRNVWTAAADASGQLYTDADLTGPMALVMGSEGRGVSRIVKEKCDFVLSIPMLGRINSLNVSNAAAVLMYEVLRQRRTGR